MDVKGNGSSTKVLTMFCAFSKSIVELVFTSKFIEATDKGALALKSPVGTVSLFVDCT